MTRHQDEYHTFTNDEYQRAFALILPPDRAVQEAERLATTALIPSLNPHSPRQLAPDVLYLLSFLSTDCCARAKRLTGLTDEEFALHQRLFGEQFNLKKS